MIGKLTLTVIAAFWTTWTFAGEGEDRAAAAVERWSARAARLSLPRGRRVDCVLRHRVPDTRTIWQELRFQDGGFAVVDAADEDGRVVAFSERGELVVSDENPLWAMLQKQARFQPIQGSGIRAQQTSVTSLSDERVAPLLTTHWDQRGARSGYCYNYYTPGHVYAGCVATAMAQILRYHAWPEKPLKIETNTCFYEAAATNLTMLGGPYAWDLMPDLPGTETTDEAAREAIGRVVYDCGVAMHMSYSKAGSGAYSSGVHFRLKEVFDYRSAQTIAVLTNVGDSLDAVTMQNAILASLDAQSPVFLGICRYDPNSAEYTNGHAVVADGYGFVEGTCYVHLNMGWSGSGDVWYALPDIGAGYGFNVVDSATYNIFPAATGAVVSGQVRVDGTNAVGVTVAAYDARSAALKGQVTTDAHGLYCFVVPENTSYRVVATVGAQVQTNVVQTGVSRSFTSIDWETGSVGYYRSPECGNRWGNDFAFAQSEPELVGQNPAAGTLVLKAGEMGSFGVQVTNPQREPLLCRWFLDGELAKGTGETTFVLPTTYADHGEHEVSCQVFVGERTVPLVATWRVVVSADLFVGKTGNDETGTGEADAPFLSIGAALKVSVAGDVVYVGPGVYFEVVEAVSNVTAICSLEGPEQTVIDAEYADLCYYGAEAPETLLTGFTLQHGSYPIGGGALGGWLEDCIVADCEAFYYDAAHPGEGGGAADAYLEDCWLVGNLAETGGGGAAACGLVGCVLLGNQAGSFGGGAAQSELDGCTVVGNRAWQARTEGAEFAGGGVDCDCLCARSIVWGNDNGAGLADNWETYLRRTRLGVMTVVPSMQNCCTEPFISVGTRHVFANPRLVDLFGGDVRLYETSPCLGAAEGGGNIGAWQGSGLVIDMPALPLDATETAVRATVAATGYADPRVAKEIAGDAVRYASFRAWALDSGLGSTAVALASRAYLSYLLRDVVAVPYLLSDAGEAAFELPAFSWGNTADAWRLTVRLVDDGRTVPLAAFLPGYVGKLRLGTGLTALRSARADDLLGAEARSDGTVDLTIRSPGGVAGFFGVGVE